jgi:hypothetical protein
MGPRYSQIYRAWSVSTLLNYEPRLLGSNRSERFALRRGKLP